jgi:hypothetical protein
VSPAVIVAVIVGLFFVIGVTVGIIAVVALSAVRRERGELGGGQGPDPLGGPLVDPNDPNDPNELNDSIDPENPDDAAGYGTGASGVAGHWDGVISDGGTAERPRWPGDQDA